MKIYNFICIFFLLFNAGTVHAQPIVPWKTNLIFGEAFYPSYAIANSTFKGNSALIKSLNASSIKGDLQGQIGIEVSNLAMQDYRLKVQIECEELINVSTEEISVSSKSKDFFFYPHLDYKWDALRKSRQNRPVTAKITVWIDGKFSETKLKTFSLQSINNCPYTCINKANQMLDLNYMYAAYVNEDNPLISDVLLKEILSQGAIKQIDGYQSGKAQEVFKQVFAVWNTLRKRGISYSSLSATTLTSDSSLPLVFQQYVRTVEDALQSKQANCVDGTVLMASILYRMGLKPRMVITPNHCFLSYALDGDEQVFAYLETTALQTEMTPEFTAFAKTVDIYDAALAEKFGDGYTSFIIATIAGLRTYQKDAAHFNKHLKFIQLSFITDENRNELIKMLQYQIFTVDKFKKQGLQSVFK